MVTAGVLLIVDSPAWPYFGLVGGGTYIHFAGRWHDRSRHRSTGLIDHRQSVTFLAQVQVGPADA